MRIFLSYRRADAGGHAGRLADTLVQRLGARNVFQDVTDIAAGRDFATTIREALDSCDAALAVIGPGWLAAATPDGRPRLFDPDDYVRLELATVLQRDLAVVPVLVGGATLPAASELPEDLRPLAQRQAIEVRDATWHQDVGYLLRSLGGDADGSPAPRRVRPVLIAAAATTVLVTVGLLAWRPWSGPGADSGPSGTSAAPLACADPSGPGWTELPISATARVSGDLGYGPQTVSVRRAAYREVQPGRWDLIVDTLFLNDGDEDVYNGNWRYPSIVVAQRPFDQVCFEPQPELVRPHTAGDARTGYVVSCLPQGRIQLILADPASTRLAVTDGPVSTAC